MKIFTDDICCKGVSCTGKVSAWLSNDPQILSIREELLETRVDVSTNLSKADVSLLVTRKAASNIQHVQVQTQSLSLLEHCKNLSSCSS